MIPRSLSEVCYISADGFPGCFHLLTISKYIIHNICYKNPPRTTADVEEPRCSPRPSRISKAASSFILDTFCHKLIPRAGKLVPPIATQKQVRQTFPERVGRSVAHVGCTRSISTGSFQSGFEEPGPTSMALDTLFIITNTSKDK
jgi:hypothetical protein